MRRSTHSDDSPELQAVLTRYIDSQDGYIQAARWVKVLELAATFTSVASRRSKVADGLRRSIREQGHDPKGDGSAAAKVHRWWIKLRKGVTADDLKTVLSECRRGEVALERTIMSICGDGHLNPKHLSLMEQALADVRATIASLKDMQRRS